MADPSPEYPFGKPISVIKPGIPIHAQDDHGEITINDIEAYLNSKSTNVTFKGVLIIKIILQVYQLIILRLKDISYNIQEVEQ